MLDLELLNGIKDTIATHLDELKNEPYSINELLIEDILAGLGYNRRKDTNIKRIYQDSLSWKIANHIGIMVSSSNDNDTVKSEVSKLSDFDCDILLVVSYNSIFVFRYKDNDFSKIYSINMQNDLSDTDKNVLKAISKEDYDLEMIDDMFSSSNITLEDLKDNLINFSSDVINVLSDSGKFIINESNKAVCKDLFDELLNGAGSVASGVSSEDVKKYRERIRELSESNAILSNENGILKEENKKLSDEVNNLEGIEDRKADQLLNVIKDEPNSDRKYITVVGSELNQYNTIYELIGRSIQKLYALKGLDAAQYIYSSNTFTLIDEPVRNDTIIANKAYDIDIDPTTIKERETEYINKLYILFSHYEDIKFRCKTIGTLRDTVVEEDKTAENEVADNTNNEIETSEEIAESSVKLEDTSSENDNQVDNIDDTIEEFGDAIEELGEESEATEAESEVEEANTEETDEVSFGEETETSENEEIQTEDIEVADDGFDEIAAEEIGDTEEFGEESSDEETGNEELFSTDNIFGEETTVDESDIISDGDESFGDNSDDNGDDDAIDFGDDDEPSEETEEESTEDIETVDIEDTATGTLCAVQFDELAESIWNKDLTFGNIKYISNDCPDNPVSDLMFLINDDNINRSTIKVIDAMLSIGVKTNTSDDTNIVALIRTIDLSEVNNFISLLTDETKDYTRINNTKYVLAPLEDTRQSFSVIKDVVDALKIDTTDAFVYMYVDSETEEGKQFIEEHKFSEDDITLEENIEYRLPDDYDEETDANNAIAIVRGDLFNNIVVTVNSISAISKIIKSTVAVKTSLMGVVLKDSESVSGAIAELVMNGINDGRSIDAGRIGNVLGESYRIISFDENDVNENHTSIETRLGTLYISDLEQWQIIHAMIKLQSTIFNNNNIVLKCIIDVDALNFYGTEFKTVEPSLSIAVQSFTDYMATHQSKKVEQ